MATTISLLQHKHRLPWYLGMLVLLLSACSEPPSAPAGQRKPPLPLVEVVPVVVAPVTQETVITGTLSPLREVRLLTQEEGRLESLPVQVGDRVAQDQVLGAIDDKLLRTELQKALAARHQAERDVERLARLKRQNFATEDELARARTTLDMARADEAGLRVRVNQTRLLAPFDGVVSARLAEPGDILPRHTHILTLSDTSSLLVQLPVSELLLPSLAIDDQVVLTMDALGATRLNGRILRIHPTLDPSSRLGTVEVILDTVPEGARPGQLCRVQLSASGQPQTLIPLATLRSDNKGNYVFRLESDGKVKRVNVVSGRYFGDRVAILSGLLAGERIVSRGFTSLSDGKAVELVESHGQ